MKQTLKTREKEGVVLVDASGKVTFGEGTDAIRAKILELLGQGWRHIIVNLEAATYLDSCALGDLVAAYATVVSLGGRMALVNSRRVNDVLVISKLHMVFDIFDDETAAIESLTDTETAQASAA